MQRQRSGGPYAAKALHGDGAHEGSGRFNGGAGKTPERHDEVFASPSLRVYRRYNRRRT